MPHALCVPSDIQWKKKLYCWLSSDAQKSKIQYSKKKQNLYLVFF